MAFNGVVCCIYRCQILISFLYVRQPTNILEAQLFDGLSTCLSTRDLEFDSILKSFFDICR